MKVEKFIDKWLEAGVYKKTLLTEKYRPPRLIVEEADITVLGYDLITSGSTIIGISPRAVGPINEPTIIDNAQQVRNIFGNV